MLAPTSSLSEEFASLEIIRMVDEEIANRSKRDKQLIMKDKEEPDLQISLGNHSQLRRVQVMKEKYPILEQQLKPLLESQRKTLHGEAQQTATESG